MGTKELKNRLTVKFSLLILSNFVLFSVILIFVLIIPETSIHDLHNRELFLEKLNNFTRILELKSDKLHTYSIDYTFWDEMVTFVNTHDKQWSKDNLENSMEYYNADVLWICDSQFQNPYIINTRIPEFSNQLPFPLEATNSLFQTNPFAHFFVPTSAGMLEIYSASIHSTKDPKRTAKPNGYFFAGHILDNSDIEELSAITKAKITVVTNRGEVSSHQSFTHFYPLPSWNNVAYNLIQVHFNNPELESANRNFIEMILIFLFLSISLLGFISFFMIKWVSVPLGLIYESLRDENPIKLSKLKDKEDEFGLVSRLVIDYFQQKMVLRIEVAQRKKSEEEAFDNAEQFRLLFSEMLNGFVLFETLTTQETEPVNFRFLKTNKYFEQLTGMTADHFIDQRLTDIFPQNALWIDSLIAVAKTAVPLRMEQYSNYFNKYFELSIFVPRKNQIALLFNDITERKSSEEKIIAARDYYIKLLDEFPNPIWRSNTHSDGDYFNEAWLTYTDSTMEEQRGRSWLNWIHPDDREEFSQNYLDFFILKQSFKLEYRLRYRDGEYRWMINYGMPFYDQKGDFAGFINSCFDIHDRKVMEVTLSESQRRLWDIFVNIDLIAVILDENGNLEFCNNYFLDLTGWTLEEVVGKNWFLTFTPDHQEEMLEVFKKALHHINVVAHYENPIRLKNGDIRTIYWNNILLKDIHGNPIGTASIGEDVTESRETQKLLFDLNETLEKRVQEELRKNREKDAILIKQGRDSVSVELLSNISHYWRNPLNMIGLNAQNLYNRFESGKLDKEIFALYVKNIMETLSNLSKSIEEFSNFFKSDAVKTEFDILVSIEQTISLIEDSFRSEGIEMILSSNANPRIIGYPKDFSGVILNILTNAKDAFHQKKITQPQIRITVTQSESRCDITIEDNAGGIPENILDKVFDPYFTTKSHSVGIGLYMCRIIIEQNMGGSITAENSKEGAVIKIQLQQ